MQTNLTQNITYPALISSRYDRRSSSVVIDLLLLAFTLQSSALFFATVLGVFWKTPTSNAFVTLMLMTAISKPTEEDLPRRKHRFYVCIAMLMALQRNTIGYNKAI